MPETTVRAPVTPSVLRWARESLAIPLDAVARRFGFTEDRVLAWESGAERPTMNQLSDLARYYHRPSAVFFMPEPPPEPPQPTDFRVVRGTEAPSLSKTALLAMRRARRIQRLTRELAEELEIDLTPPAATVDMRRGGPEVVAGQQRGVLGITVEDQLGIDSPYAAFRAWRGAVEEQDIIVLSFPMPSGEIRAFSLADDRSPIISLNSKDTITARIFSLFHEFAHILIGHQGMCLPEQHFRRSRRSNRTEVYCNHFAGALLVPTPALLSEYADRDPKLSTEQFIVRTAKRFHVSRQVLARRMLIAGLIGSDKHRDLVAQWGWFAPPQIPQETGKKSGFSQPEHETCLRRRGRRFATLVLEAGRRGLLLDSQMAEYLGVRMHSLERVESLLASP